MNIVTIEEQTFKQVCGRFSGFVSQVKRICRENTHQPEKWLSGREVCALLGISVRSLQNYRDSGKLGYSQIGNKLYYKSADIEKLVAERTANHVSRKKNNYMPTNKSVSTYDKKTRCQFRSKPIFHSSGYCRYMGKFKSSSYGNGIPK